MRLGFCCRVSTGRFWTLLSRFYPFAAAKDRLEQLWTPERAAQNTQETHRTLGNRDLPSDRWCGVAWAREPCRRASCRSDGGAEWPGGVEEDDSGQRRLVPRTDMKASELRDLTTAYGAVQKGQRLALGIPGDFILTATLAGETPKDTEGLLESAG